MAPKLFDAGKNVWVGPGNLTIVLAQFLSQYLEIR